MIYLLIQHIKNTTYLDQKNNKIESDNDFWVDSHHIKCRIQNMGVTNTSHFKRPIHPMSMKKQSFHQGLPSTLTILLARNTLQGKISQLFLFPLIVCVEVG